MLSLRPHCILWNNPTILLTPAICYDSYFGMRNGRDCWKLYFAWGRFEIGIKWFAKPRNTD